MLKLEQTLKLPKCPHCAVDRPNLVSSQQQFNTATDDSLNLRTWRVYTCARCGGVVTAACDQFDGNRNVIEFYPSVYSVSDILPEKVRIYLQQAIDSIVAPAGSVMLCASSVDAMLKEKGYKDGNLYPRINKAESEGLLTTEMAKWAHQVRLDANNQRHSDEEVNLPTIEDAKQSIEFTKTLAEFLFILPYKVVTGIQSTTKSKTDSNEGI